MGSNPLTVERAAPTAPLEHLKQTWETLGAEDPLWAIVSHADKRGGRWELAEFLTTGENDVGRYHRLLLELPGCPALFNHVLDFGCGVGRLSLAWSKRARQVTGVDISKPMIEYGQRVVSQTPNVKLILNQRGDLRCFADAQFDLVCSHICLQHIPWSLASAYFAEFSRVCSPNGFVAIQAPSREVKTNRPSRWRRKAVESLPFGLGAAYRRWRHGSGAVFDVYYTPPAQVIAAADSADLKVLRQEPDQSAGPGAESFIYIFRRTTN